MSDQPLDLVLTPDYPEEYAVLLASLTKATDSWRHELNGLSPDAIVWQPAPQGHSIGGILLHLAAEESYWTEAVGSGREISVEENATYLDDAMNPLAGIWPTPPHEPLGYYFGLLDKVRNRTFQSVRAFEEPTTVKTSAVGNMTLRWVLAHVVWHESYHGGQAVLLRSLYESLR